MNHVIVTYRGRRYRCHGRHPYANGPSALIRYQLPRHTSGTPRRDRRAGRRCGRRCQRLRRIHRVLMEFRRRLSHFQTCDVTINGRHTSSRNRRRCRRRHHVSPGYPTTTFRRVVLVSVVGGVGHSRSAYRRRRDRPRRRVPQVGRHVRPVPTIDPLASGQRYHVYSVPFVSVRIEPHRRHNRYPARRCQACRSICRRRHTVHYLTRRVSHLKLGLMTSDLRRGTRRGGRPRPVNSSRAHAVRRQGQDGRHTSGHSRHYGHGLPFPSHEVGRRLLLLLHLPRARRGQVASLRGRRRCRRYSRRKSCRPPVILGGGVNVRYRL